MLAIIDSSLSSALEHKQANQSEASAGSDQGPTTLRKCSIETYAIFSNFLYFLAGSVDFKLVMVKCCVWGTFKKDARYLARFEGDILYILYLSKTKL